MFEIVIQQETGTRSETIDKPEVLIGRRNEFQAVDLDLTPDDSVSRVHARLCLVEAGVQIEDLDSSLGTTVNGNPVKAPTLVEPGDTVVVGETTLAVTYKAARRRRSKPQMPTPVEEVKSGAAVAYKLELELQQKGKRKALVIDKTEAFVGRKHEEHIIDVDLSGDLSVSRLHAHIWEQEGNCWIEDLGSLHGVKLNDELISSPCIVRKTDRVKIGSTIMRVQLLANKPSESRPKPKGKRRVARTGPLAGEEASKLPPDGRFEVFKANQFPWLPPAARKGNEAGDEEVEGAPVGEIKVVQELAWDAAPEINTVNASKSLEYFRALMTSPREFADPTDLEALGDCVVKRLIEVIPGGERAALYVTDAGARKLIAKAHLPALKPILSSRLARRAIAGRKGFAWKQSDKEDSIRRLPIQGGMYAPLLCGEEECGLLTVDTTQAALEYAPEDLSFYLHVAQLVAVFVHRQQLMGG